MSSALSPWIAVWPFKGVPWHARLGAAVLWQLVVAMLLMLLTLAPLRATGQTESRSGDAASAAVQRIEPLIHQGQLSMDIDIEMSLSDAMTQALRRGVPLTFTIEVEIDQPRWWWFDKVLVDARLTRRVSFNTLTRQWRVSIGDLGLVVGTYTEALDLVRRVRGWEVSPIDRFEFNTEYTGRVRIMLDSNQLSRPMQLDASKRSDWTLSSPWRNFEFKVSTEDSGS